MVLERSYRRSLRGDRMSRNDAPECAKEGEECERERCGTSMCGILPSALRWLKTTTDGRGRPVYTPRKRNCIVCSMEAKELRGQRGSKSGRVPAVLFIKTHPVTLVSRIRWA